MKIGLSPRDEAWRRRGPRNRPVPEPLARLLDEALATNSVVRIRGMKTDEDHAEARDTVSLARAHARRLGMALRVQPVTWDRQPSSEESRVTSTIAFEMYRPGSKGNTQ